MTKRQGKRTKLTSSHNLYHIGRCPVQDWDGKFLQELSMECYLQIIQGLPYLALTKRRTKLKLSKQMVCFKNRKILMQDIGYCKQYGCSVLFMVKDAARSYEAIGLLCSGLFQATSIFEILSEGYKHASHPTFDSSDPWENTTGGDFFDDSLQDSTFYDTMKMYNSMAELEVTPDNDDLADFDHITPFINTCFSMEDISKPGHDRKMMKLRKNNSKLHMVHNEHKISLKSNSSIPSHQIRAVPTNAVKPIIRQSYHDVLRSRQSVDASLPNKKFAYRVSKI